MGSTDSNRLKIKFMRGILQPTRRRCIIPHVEMQNTNQKMEKDVVVSASDGMLRHRFTGDEVVVMQGRTGRCSRASEFFTACVCEPLRMLNFLL
jgi:ABC-type Na+ transport system ATPase subunit NatA